VKRWVAYQRQRGHAAQPLFVVEAESEREALCLASDAALSHEAPAHGAGAGAAPAGPWAGPMVHVRLADESPDADVEAAERRMASGN
jgi:hypothetical protein